VSDIIAAARLVPPSGKRRKLLRCLLPWKIADRMMTGAAEVCTALFRSSPFLDCTGPFYPKGHGRSLSAGQLVGESRIVRASGVFADSQSQNQ
jgi:hypothetical protein